MENLTLEMIDNFEIHLGLLIADVANTAFSALPEYEWYVEENLDIIKKFSDKYIGYLFHDLGLDI
jgi:hypothetical protein